MKTAKWNRILAVVLTLSMIVPMMLVFTVFSSAEEGGKTYTLDVANLSFFAAGDKDNGDYEKAGTDNYFTVFYSEKTKIETSSAKTFTYGTGAEMTSLSATNRIAWGAKTEIGDQILNAVKIKTQGSAIVRLLWVGGEPDRNPAIFNADGSVLVKDTTATVKNDPYVTEFEIPSAGIYYIGNLVGSNYFYQIQVIDSCDGDKPADRASWATVGTPAIKSAVDNGLGNLVVDVDALIGHDGGDELLVHMYKGDELIATKGSVTEKSSHTLIFTPADSGSYTFKAELLRDGEEKKVAADTSANFVYVLAAPYISSVTSQGGGSIEVKWSGVHEAESYNIYQDGEKIATVGGDVLSYLATGLTIDQEYSYVVAAVRGSEEVKSSAMSTIASQEAKQAWGFTVYGPSTNEDNNGYIGSVNDDGQVTVYSEGGKGKIQPNSVDGLAFYYTAVPTEYNFTLRATISVDSWTLSNGQEGFGLLVTDRLGTNGDKGNIWNNSYLAGSTKIEYRYNSDADEIVNIATQNTALTKFSMKLGIGVVARTGVTPENLSRLEAQDQATINNEFKTMTTTLERSAANLRDEAGTYNLIGNYTSLPAGSYEDRFLITEYIMEIQKNNSGYFISYYDKDGTLISQNKNYDPDALSQLDPDFVYAGFFASRNAKVTFSDIVFTTILASEDKPREYPPTTYVTPSITVNSGNVTTNSKYELIVDPNVAGTLTVLYENKPIIENKALDMEERFRIDIDLEHYDENYIKIEFTPDPNQWLGDYTELSSKDTVHLTHSLMYNRGNYHRKTVYISPNVLPYTTTADGTRENPFDIFTALENAYPGQTLVLMEGTYKPGAALKIQRGMDGKEDAMIRLIADPEASTRPVIDFEGLYAGFTIGGDYWYFHGFDVTGSINMQKGIQVSGNYNILDQLHTYYNGNTGIQLSRLTGSDLYEDWPSYNLVLNCTSYCNFDSGFEDADGFAAKLTVGDGNVFDGCISYNNADDGWDLYAKVDTGSIGSVTIRNCIAYNNGFVPGYDKTGNGNGFKLGGDSLSGYHVIENSIAFGNLAKGIDSNSCPDIIVKDCISFNNGGSNIALYTNNVNNTDFSANGVISFRTDKLDVAENLRPKGSQDNAKYFNESTYYWDAANGWSMNSKGAKITADMFVSLEFTGWTRNADGTINLNGFLEIKDNVPENAANCKLHGKASADIELLEDEECSFSRAWYKQDMDAHWHYCECGNKSHVGAHEFIWVIDTPQQGNLNGKKHQECTVCGYKKATITIYPPAPETPVEPDEPNEPDIDETPDNNQPTEPGNTTEELGFFAKIWQAIVNFFKSIFGGLFGGDEEAYIPSAKEYL